MLSESPFHLYKPFFWKDDYGAVFLQPDGVFIIHCAVTHKEDYDWGCADTVPHYIVYNAGTRVLFLYPEVVVVLDEDLEDIEGFLQKLQKPPYLIRTPCHVPDKDNKELLAYLPASAGRWVRQVWFKPRTG